jgi:hypothetical protein
MRRFRGSSSAIVVTALVASLSTVLVGMAAAADEASDAFDSVAECLQERDRLVVLALVDESASLRRTDPNSSRSTAVEAVVRNLTSVAEAGGADGPDVEIKISTFATEVGDVTGWTLLSDDALPGLVRATRDLGAKDAGIDTDFATALAGARELLSTRMAELAADSTSACQTLLWFTDGDYDLEPRARTVDYAPDLRLDRPGNRERAMELGERAICEESGIVDDLHGAGVITLTVGLGLEITAENAALLERISSGAGGCGTGQGEGTGAYLAADDLDALLFAFDRASTGLLGGTVAAEDEVTPCPRERCPSGSRTFELDTSLERFHLLVTAPDPLRVEVSGPTGDPIELTTEGGASEVVGGATLRWTPLAGAFLVDGELDPSDETWVGTWTVTFIDPTSAAEDVLGRSQIVLFGALSPSLVEAGSVRRGEAAQLWVDIVDAAGTPRTPAELVAATRLEVTISDPVTGQELAAEVGQPDATGRRSVTFELADEVSSSALRAEARLVVTTVGGVEMPERRATIDVSVLPPATYPRVEPAALSLGPITGTERATTEITLVGGEDDGCVWFGDSTMSGGRDLGDVALVPTTALIDEGSCLEVEAGNVETVTIEVQHEGNRGGSSVGSLPVFLTSVGSDQIITQDVPVEVEFLRVIDTGRRLTVFLVVFLLGLLLPIAFLSLVNRVTARFRDPAFVRVATVPVHQVADRLERRPVSGSGPSAPLTLGIDDFRSISAPAGDLSEVNLPGLRLKRRVPHWPLRPPVGTALAEGTDVTTASGGHRVMGGRTTGVLSLALPSQWVLAVDDRSDEDGDVHTEGRLWVFIKEGVASPDLLDVVVARLLRELPPVVATLPAPPPSVDETQAGDEPQWTPPEGVSRPSAWSPPADPAGGWSPPGGGWDGAPVGDPSTSEATLPDPSPAPSTQDQARVWRPPTD